ncbi:hypothetical protein SAMN05444273_107238 [Litoreibacter ascidiaceicola]|uniref:Uncharacterized protein n=1 Tax=Litoreibacter ascidiaceicola TaxID=1486859 RepID=A0A1M5CRA1_9RHOB|nr:hypothetical protein SAMN05444273_107238 [Litoreibacter ascidiaceicola]
MLTVFCDAIYERFDPRKHGGLAYAALKLSRAKIALYPFTFFSVELLNCRTSKQIRPLVIRRPQAFSNPV